MKTLSLKEQQINKICKLLQELQKEISSAENEEEVVTDGIDSEKEELQNIFPHESLDLLFRNIQELLQSSLDKFAETANSPMLQSQLSEVSKKLDNLKERDLVMEKMYNELQSYKNGFHLNLFKPILHSLLQLNDNMNMILSYQKKNIDNKTLEELHHTLVNEYQNVIYQIEDIISENGLCKYNGPLVGESFDPTVQTIKGVIETDDPGKNKIVSEIITPGYKITLDDGREFLFKKEFVEIYKYNKTN
ncbi:nucleotide exchange factor GrpE [Parabacteroides sp.]